MDSPSSTTVSLTKPPASTSAATPAAMASSVSKERPRWRSVLRAARRALRGQAHRPGAGSRRWPARGPPGRVQRGHGRGGAGDDNRLAGNRRAQIRGSPYSCGRRWAAAASRWRAARAARRQQAPRIMPMAAPRAPSRAPSTRKPRSTSRAACPSASTVPISPVRSSTLMSMVLPMPRGAGCRPRCLEQGELLAEQGRRAA